MNSNYYLRYTRTDCVKYVSHLDFVRVMGRAFRRANLPIAYSEGFNPHPILTFALPLSVGYTSECEIMEFVLSEETDTELIKDKLNKVLPDGIEIQYVRAGKTAMKKLDNAVYEVTPENMPPELDTFLNMKEIVIDKKTKSGIKPTDIRPDIKGIELCGNCMEMLLSAGSRSNLKPEAVMDAMNKYIKDYQSGEVDYCRKMITDSEYGEIK